MQAQKDKVIIDTADYPELKEYFSRLEVGDKCAVKRMELDLDSFDDGIAILSINDVALEKPKGGDSGGDDENEPVAAKLYKGKKKAAADDDDGDEEDAEMAAEPQAPLNSGI